MVVGTVRNCARTIDRTIKSISAACADSELDYYLVESDSSDRTVSRLTTLASGNSSFEFVSLGDLASDIPDRIERIAHCRNVYIQKAIERSNDYEYLVVADFDGVNAKLEPGCITRAMIMAPEFGAIFANSRFRYYDILALRLPPIVTEDYRLLQLRLIENGVLPLVAKLVSHINVQCRLHFPNEFTPVDSAFGGLGVYSLRAIQDARYVPKSNRGESICEHVPFNSLVARNAPLFIARDIKNGPAWQHIWMSFSLFRLLLRVGARVLSIKTQLKLIGMANDGDN